MADVYEKDLAQKTLVTADDYVRVVGTDNVSYKQQIKFMPSQYVVQSGTDLLAYIKTLGTGTYFIRMDNVSGLPSGGVVYRIVKTHGANDARASIIAIPMDATASIYTAFITSASATSISWVQQPTRAEVDALKINKVGKTFTGITCSAGGYVLLTNYTSLGIARNKIVTANCTTGNYLVMLQYASEGIYLFSHSAISNQSISFDFYYWS